MYAQRASVRKIALLGVSALALAAPSIMRAAAISADISVTKSVMSPTPVHPGDVVIYLITVANNGPDAASNIVLTDPVPFGATFVSFDTGASGIVCTTPPLGGTGTVTCPWAPAHPSVPMGESYELEMQVRVGPTPGKAVANTVTVTSDSPDPDLTNNSATAQAEVDAAPSVPLSGAGLFAMGLALAAGGFLLLKR